MLVQNKKYRSRTRINSFRKKTKSTCKFPEIYQKAKEIKRQKTGLTNIEITKYLNCSPHFLGCFMDDEIQNLKLSPGCLLIVNLDVSNQPGSHWIALGIFQNTIEVFDPLGFQLFSWPSLPVGLLSFLHSVSQHKTVNVSPPIQSKTSTLCGLYCIFYVLLRPKFSVSAITNYFSSHLSTNDSKLIRFFH